MIPSINQLKSTTAISSQKKKKQNILHSKTANEASLAIKPLPSILKLSKSSNKLSKLNQNKQNGKPSVNFPALSLAISPTNSVDRNCEKMSTATDSNSNTYTATATDSNSNPNSRSNEIGNNNNNIGTIKENKTLSLLSPDLNDVIVSIKKAEIKSFGCEDIKDMNQAFERFDDYIVYDKVKLFDENIADFMNEKEKLEQKLNDAMTSYESNNVEYLNKILEQYRSQKLKMCQAITDQQTQTAFLKKLQNDLEILDDSLKVQFKESQKTLYSQLSAIHHQRLKDFATKLSQRSIENDAKNEVHETEQTERTLQVGQCQKSTNVNDENMDAPKENIVCDNELNVTLKEVSKLLEKCWKNEVSKKQKQRCDQQQEIGTLKEILSVYQNLSKLVQLQSNTLKTTIVDFENLCNENNYAEEVAENEQEPNNSAQIQLLSSADHISTAKSVNSGKKKRRKSKKSSKKNGCKTPAFSFEYNRGTVSSKNKKAKMGSKKKKKIKKTS